MVDAAQAERLFTERFGGKPRLFRAPGRVNLIGEHTDYNDGFVMPLAIDRDTVAAVSPREDSILRIYSENIKEEVKIDLSSEVFSAVGSWTSYVEGVARVLMSKGHVVRGADMLLLSDVPEGAGLSSSAALELSAGTALKAINGIQIDAIDLALVAQRAEHEYAGTQCGIMDQYISAAGTIDHALLIDCRSLTYTPVAIADPRASWVVIDTKVKHNLASSAYNERRRQCDQAVAAIAGKYPEVKALRDVTFEMLESTKERLDAVVYRRAKHVINENARTLRAAKALGDGDLELMGKLMFESHESLAEDYEVTSRELDFLVEQARLSPACFGSRMTGGGFGGCTISLVQHGDEESFGRALVASYRSEFGFAPEVIRIRSAQGAHEITI